MIFKLKNWKPYIPSSCYIHKSSVIIGRVKLGENVSVWPLASIRADVEEIIIGDDTNIQDCCVIHVNWDRPVIMGNRITVGHGAVIHGAKIGDRCLIGMKAVVLESEIGDDCLIAAGSLISPGKKIPPRSLVMGVPGKVIKELNDEELKSLAKGNKDYIELAQIYKKGCSCV